MWIIDAYGQVGEGVKNVKEGQRVVPLNTSVKGSWQEYMCVPGKDV